MGFLELDKEYNLDIFWNLGRHCVFYSIESALHWAKMKYEYKFFLELQLGILLETSRYVYISEAFKGSGM